MGNVYLMSQSLIAICPKCNHEELYKGTAKRPRIHCAKCHHRYYIKTDQTPKERITEKTRKPSQSSFIPPQNDFIDDPDELLMSVAIRELNKAKPDPRWASILINCKKENISTKGDDIESFRKLPNQVLATLLSKSKQKMS